MTKTKERRKYKHENERKKKRAKNTRKYLCVVKEKFLFRSASSPPSHLPESQNLPLTYRTHTTYITFYIECAEIRMDAVHRTNISK